MDTLLACLTARHDPPADLANATAWWAIHQDISRYFAGSTAAWFDTAVAVGASSDRVAWAFASGYASALHRLVPALAATSCAVLCATESGGAHPSAIRTTYDAARGTLDGHKRWSTLADVADTLLVVASEGTGDDGRNRLRLVRVEAGAPGVTVSRMPETPFVPEIGHAEVHLANVAVDARDVLAGDGYTQYLKPFRTIEDTHVVGAVLGYVAGVARRCGWTHAAREDVLGAIALVRAVSLAEASSANTHVLLAAALRHARAVLDVHDGEWSKCNDDERARWARDRVLLSVADRTREARRASAWATIGRNE